MSRVISPTKIQQLILNTWERVRERERERERPVISGVCGGWGVVEGGGVTKQTYAYRFTSISSILADQSWAGSGPPSSLAIQSKL